ncbi:PilZ domain-containing protein [Ureibacillus manganicus]|uniref:PilZ domain-containing protein n=1 Tax=Ureibacillus manganicus DSM 26584 TaxID=1384049 RepID=A0A0A3I1A4_9BACL|nr:PilZ domain-containing protein [Ureibacillus manganicus]KGR77260.1 hypothetical protein CD29_15470 [Ureibacillus manganicus DSM 26584]
MQFKRNESFRYSFGQPVPALFKIVSINGREVNSASGKAEIVDISPEGIRMTSELNIPDIKLKQPILSITFNINDKPFQLNGLIMWKKERKNSAEYGIKLLIDDSMKSNIVGELKIHSKNMKK